MAKTWRRALVTVGLLMATVAAGCNSHEEVEGRFRLDTVAGSPARALIPGPLPPGDLAPGNYYAATFRPMVEVEVPEGWRSFQESPGSLTLVHGRSPEPESYLTLFRRSLLVVDDRPHLTSNELRRRATAPLEGPYVDIVRGLDGVVVEPGPTAVVLGRVTDSEQMRWDVPPLTGGEDCPPERPCPQPPRDGSSGMFYYLSPGIPIAVFELPEHGIVATVETSDPSGFDALIRPVLESIRLVEPWDAG